MPKRMMVVTPSPRRVRSRWATARRTRAATMIQRKWRSRKAASRAVRRRPIGSTLRTGNCKSVITDEVQPPVTRLTNELYFQDITDCNRGGLPNQRERGVINCRGFKWEYFFYNRQALAPMYVNIAMVAPKSIQSVNPVTPSAFFRANGSNRATNFAPLGDTPFIQHMRSINPDDYTVLWHKRFILGPANTQSGPRFPYKKLSGYTKLSRQLTYDEPESPVATDGRVCICYWFGRVGGADLAQVAEVDCTHKTIMYFKEPK